MTKLNLACGNMPQHGYKNMDKYYYPPGTEMHPEHGKPEDYDWEQGDLTDLSMFDDNSIEEVMIVHGLEHTYWDGAVHCIKEIYRILEPGGVVDIEVPDLDAAFRFGNEDLQDIVFGGRTENALTFGHFCGFTKNTLLELMESVSFRNIVETEVGKATGAPEPDRNFRLKGEK